jgi:hypothetical protein
VKLGPSTKVTNASRPAVGAAYVAAALFVVAFARFFVLPPEGRGNVLVALLGVAPHLLLFPVVAMLPAPRSARAAGYGWLVVDMGRRTSWLLTASPSRPICRCATEDTSLLHC